jgi:hypothetical protein
MNYLKLYCKIVRNEEAKGLTKKQAKEQGLYVEGHHIFPRCIYGQHKDGNKRVIYVTPRVHYILHALLEKAFIKRYGVDDSKTICMTSAHIKMKGYEYNEKYYNSYLYENARKRLSNALKGKKRPKHIGVCVSKARKNNYKGRNNPSTVAIKVFFDDDNCLEYYDGIRNFCGEYGYCVTSIGYMLNGRIKKYKNIIKVEKIKLEKPKVKKVYKQVPSGKNHLSSIPIRIYFSDGRILEWEDGTGDFCRKNPKYRNTGLQKVRNGERDFYKDIVKIEDMRVHKEASSPIVKSNYNKNYVPIKVYFSDGRVIFEEYGAAEFCRKFPQYERRSITRLGLKRKKRHRDIIKVERLNDQ